MLRGLNCVTKWRERVCVVSGSHNGENERECAVSVREKCVCAVSVNGNVKEDEFLEDESIYRQSLSCARLQVRGTKINVADVVVSTNHLTFLTNRFGRLISLPTSAIFGNKSYHGHFKIQECKSYRFFR